jgi:hypothetical protein
VTEHDGLLGGPRSSEQGRVGFLFDEIGDGLGTLRIGPRRVNAHHATVLRDDVAAPLERRRHAHGVALRDQEIDVHGRPRA